MITASKCNCCTHELICRHKDEYAAAVGAIRKAVYPANVGNSAKAQLSMLLSVSIRCEFMHVRPEWEEAHNEASM